MNRYMILGVLLSLAGGLTAAESVPDRFKRQAVRRRR